MKKRKYKKKNPKRIYGDYTKKEAKLEANRLYNQSLKKMKDYLNDKELIDLMYAYNYACRCDEISSFFNIDDNIYENLYNKINDIFGSVLEEL